MCQRIWLRDVRLEQLHKLSDSELSELGLSADDRLRFKLFAAIKGVIALSAPVTEIRPITVTFLDLVESTALSVRLGHEDFLTLLSQYYDVCKNATSRYGGQITQFSGDGVLALFCLPTAHENDPERGVRAALYAVEEVGRLRAADGSRISARGGVATGRVLAWSGITKAFNAQGNNYGHAVGSTLHLAARLQAAASPGGIMISAETAMRLPGRFILEDKGLRDAGLH